MDVCMPWRYKENCWKELKDLTGWGGRGGTGVWGEFVHCAMYTCEKVSLYSTVLCTVKWKSKKTYWYKGSYGTLYDEYNKRIQSN